MSGSFCQRAWERTRRLQDAIVDHPFNQALAAGTLDHDRFAFYLVQDQRYLDGFARALAAATTRTPNSGDAAFLARSAHTALVVERELHAGYLEKFGVTPTRATGIETAPSALAYVSYLQATALAGDNAQLLAALLPCFWVYEHVGTTILDRVGDLSTHPYAAWIETYADEDFAASVATLRGIVDRLATEVDEPGREAMFAAFERGCEYEWMFWDAAWRQETWPTARWREGAARDR